LRMRMCVVSCAAQWRRHTADPGSWQSKKNMEALRYIVSALLWLAVFAFLMRVILQIVRADFRNPIAEAVLRITNPLVLPLRRVIPPLRKLDLASIVALLLVELAAQWIILSLSGLSLGSYGTPTIGLLLHAAIFDLAVKLLQFYIAAVLIYVLLSWVAPGASSPAGSLLSSICEPILAPVRKAVPLIGGLDLSPLFVLIGLQALLILLRSGL
jgi:YggT family protein